MPQSPEPPRGSRACQTKSPGSTWKTLRSDSWRRHSIRSSSDTTRCAPADSVDRETGPSAPSYWPLDSIFQPGVLTRRQTLADGPGVQHGGVDIAVRAGTQIRAAGGGTVREAGYDVEYGWFVLIDHPDDYQTMYGHASRLLVAAQDSVDAGQVIALAGSTGRSTAPHLHFEKRRGNQLIDPLERLNKEQ